MYPAYFHVLDIGRPDRMPVASNTEIASKYFRTNDGVRLHYLEAGAGKPLVLIHGLSQTAEQFKFQIEGLPDRHRVIALDLRGHGESEKPNFGLKIHRLAEDLRVSGTKGGHTINLHQFAHDGVSLLGRLAGVGGGVLTLAGDLHDNLAAADRAEAELLKAVDAYVAQTGMV